AAGRVGRTVVLRMRFNDFSRATRSHTLPRPTSETGTMLAAARALFMSAAPMIKRDGLTMVGLAIANLDDDDAVPLVLPFDGPLASLHPPRRGRPAPTSAIAATPPSPTRPLRRRQSPPLTSSSAALARGHATAPVDRTSARASRAPSQP